METLSTAIYPTLPFNFHLTASHQTYYRGESGADVYVDGVYRRALEHGGGPFIVSVRETGSPKASALEVTVTGADVTAEDLAFAANRIAWMLGLDLDMGPFYDVLARDPVLSEAVEGLYGLRPPRTATVFEALVLAIAGQQISGVIAWLIRRDLVRSYGAPVDLDGRAYYAFPTPQALLEGGVQGLRGVRLSTRKAEYILDICTLALEGSRDLERLRGLRNDEVVQALSKTRGVGRWTAEWVLLRALGRADVFPAGDLALRRVLSELYFGGRPLTDREAAEFAQERWAPYQALATTYLFAHLRQQRLQREAEQQGDVSTV